MDKNVVVFDLDGTLALTEHRTRFVALRDGSRVIAAGAEGIYRGPHASLLGDVWVEHEGTGKWAYDERDVKFTPDWRGFFAACVDDLPNLPVIAALHAHRAAGHQIVIASGRSDEVREKTRAWLFEHVFAGLDISVPVLMRAEGDYTPDEELKRGWLRDGSIPKERVLAVYDDRDKVVDMWRAEGLACFQVARGNF